MQWHDSTKKSPTKLNVTEIKFDTAICLRMRKNTKAKISLSDFKVTTPKNPLLSITRGCKYKETCQTHYPIPKYQLIVEPLPQYPIRPIL